MRISGHVKRQNIKASSSHAILHEKHQGLDFSDVIWHFLLGRWEFEKQWKECAAMYAGTPRGKNRVEVKVSMEKVKTIRRSLGFTE